MNSIPSRLQRLPIPAALTRGLATAGLLLPGFALAGGPSGGVVAAGGATINKPSANGTVITQSTGSAVINWSQFNIGSGDYVQFIQPSSSSVVLNRVIGGSPSQILGDLSANGRVFIINPQGVLFGAGARVDVGALVASNLDIKDADFMSGHYLFSGDGGSGSAVINDGNIKTADGGFVVLAGDYVKNTGVIEARLGKVVLASGSAVTMALDPQGLVSVAVDQATLAQKAGVDNAGQLLADGGQVVMTAATARGLAGSAVNNSGLVRAQGIAAHDGEIELTAAGGDISDSGTLDASNAAGNGGQVQIKGDQNIALTSASQILASGSAAGGAVQVVADGTLTTAAASLIDAHGAAGQGGYAEVSGHGKLLMRGDVKLGSGGTLLIDPTNLFIANGTGSSTSTTVYEQFLESELQGGTNLELVASNSITLNKLTDGVLNGSNAAGSVPGSGGSLLLGIGSISSVSGAAPVGGSFAVFTGGTFIQSGSGTISFNDNTNLIKVDGALDIEAGTLGMINVGNLQSNNQVTLNGGQIVTGNITGRGVSATAQSQGINVGNISSSNGITLDDANNGGAMVFGNLNASYGGIVVVGGNANVSGGSVTASVGTVSITEVDGSVTTGAIIGNSVTVSGSDNVGAGDITATSGDISIGSRNGSVTVGDLSATNRANAAGTISANVNVQAHSGITTGNISTSAIAANPVAADATDASVTLNESYGGTVLVSGTINTTAIGGNSNNNATVDLRNQSGSVNVSGNITTVASGAGAGGSVSMSAAGNINAQAIAVGTGIIDLDTFSPVSGTTGDITVGKISGSLSSVDLNAFGGLTVNSNISAQEINLSAQNGDLSAGGIIQSGTGNFLVQDYGGAITLGTISATGNVELDALNEVKAGNIIAFGGSITVTSENGDVQLAGLSGGTGPGSGLNSVYLQAANGISTPAADTITAGHIQMEAGGGIISTGDLVTTAGNVILENSGGSVVAGNITTSDVEYGSADASVTVRAAGGISTGSITTLAQSGNSNSVDASVDLEAHSGHDGFQTLDGLPPGDPTGGALTVNGAISTSAIITNVSDGQPEANGRVQISNGYSNDDGTTIGGGAISTGDITTVTVGSTTDDAQIGIQAYNGSVTTGNLNAASAVDGNGNFVHDGNGFIFLGTDTGTLQVNGDINTHNGNLMVANSGGDVVVLGNINTFATPAGDEGGADASVGITAAGGISIGTTVDGVATSGNIDTQASASFNGTADASVDLEGHSTRYAAPASSSVAGLTVYGNINTSAQNADGGSDESNASGRVQLNDAGGDINVGDITAQAGSSFASLGTVNSNIGLGASQGAITAGNLHSYGGGVYLEADNGSLTAGDITAGNGNLIAISYGGNIVLGNISTSASGFSYHNADASVTVQSTGGISTGSITTRAAVHSGSSSPAALASVTLTANYVPPESTAPSTGGDLVVNGNILTVATVDGFSTDSGGANAKVQLTNNQGSISAQNITAFASINLSEGGGGSGDRFRGDAAGPIGPRATLNPVTSGNAGIALTANDGDITTGALAVADGNSVSVTTTVDGNVAAGIKGNINVGQISAFSSSSDGAVLLGTSDGGTLGPGQLQGVTLSAAGGITTNNTAIDTNLLTLNAANGDISTGDLTIRSEGLDSYDYGGSMTLGNVSAYGGVSLYADGGITTGDITSSTGSNISVIGAGNVSGGGNVSVGAVTGSSLNGIDLEASNGSLTVGGNNLTAGRVTLIAGNGALNASGVNVDAFFDPATLSATNGDITVGDVQADGAVTITASNGNISAGNVSAVDGSSVTITATVAGNSNVGGNISVISVNGNEFGSLGSANISAAGSLTTNGSDITANSVTLAAGNGDLSVGNVTSLDSGTLLSITDTAGKISTGNVEAAGDLTITDTAGTGIKTGNLQSDAGGAIQVTSTGNAADITVGSVTSGSPDTPLSSVTLSAGGALNAFGVDLTAGNINVSSSNGDLTTGNLNVIGAETGIVVSAVGGNLNVGNVQTNGGIALLDTGGNIGAGTLTLAAGSGATLSADGNIAAGIIDTAPSGGDIAFIDATAGGTLSLGNSTVTADEITLEAGAGNMNLGPLIAGAGGITVGNSGGPVEISSATTTAGGAISASSGSSLSYDAINASGDVTLSASGALTAANGTSTLVAGGDLSVSGGSIGLNAASAGGSISLTGGGGDVDSGNLTAGYGGNITVDTLAAGSGDIDIGAVSAASGTLGAVQITSGGALSNGGSSISAGTIKLTAADGDLTAGDLNASQVAALQVSDTGGKITLGNVTAPGAITITDTDGSGIKAGNLDADYGGAAIDVSSNAVGAGVSLGTISGGTAGSPLTSVILSSGGTLSAATTDITAGGIFLSAGAGALSFGALDALSGGISLSNNGAIKLGSVNAAGDVALNATGGNITVAGAVDGTNVQIGTKTSGNISVGSIGGAGAASDPLSVSLVSAGSLSADLGAGITAGSIILSAGSGAVSTGALDATSGDVSVTAGNGNLSVASVDATGAAVLSASGSNTVGNVNAGSITLSSANGTLGAGALDASSGGVTVTASKGNLNVVSVDASGAARLSASGSNTVGAVNAGSITLSATSGTLGAGALDASSGGVTVTATGGDASVASISAVGKASVTAGGKATVGGVDAGSITLAAGSGALGTGALDASNGSVSLTSTGGNVTVASIASNGNVSLAAGGSAVITGTTDFGNAGVGALTLSGASVQAGDITNHSAAGAAATADAMSVSASAGGIALGAVTAADPGTSVLTLNASGGGISTGDVTVAGVKAGASGDITVGTLSLQALKPPVASSLSSSGGSVITGNVLSNGSFSVSGASGASVGTVQAAGAVQISSSAGNVGTAALSSGNGGITLSGAKVSTGNLSVTQGAVGITASAGAAVGTVGASSLAANVSGGDASFGAVNVSGQANLTVAGAGKLTVGNVDAAGLTTTVGTGNETLGNVSLSGSTLGLTLGDVAGQTLSVGNISYNPGAAVALDYNNANLSLGTVSIGDGSAFSATLGNGNLNVAGVSSGGDVALSATHGSLGVSGGLSGDDVSLSSGQALSLSGVNINAAGSFTLASGGDTSISASLIDSGSAASITSGATLDIDHSSVLGQTVTLNATGAVTVEGNSTIGAPQQTSASLGGPVAHLTGIGNSVAISSGGDILIDRSTVQTGTLSLNGADLSLSNGAVLNGSDAVVMTATGAVDASGSASSINAGALSVRGASIDLSDAVIHVGSGTAVFGSDAALLQAIKAKNPGVSVPGHGPDASFAAAGGVKLGQLTVDGGYLFIQAPTLSLPSSIGGSGLFVDYLPSDPTALLNVDLTQPLSSSIATLVYGGTPQSGNIQIGDGSKTFSLAGNTNLVFASSGTTLYPDAISSNGAVVVLGDEVLRNTNPPPPPPPPPPVQPTVDLDGLPLTQDQYDLDAPDNGILADKGDPGDPDDPGVNDANKGHIDITTGTPALACTIGGTP